ncbi:cadherin-like domain-containing protein [Sphingomonas montana]|uniref:cadherin-like domain-containing protein n=1 Tax=Sphingomonas montana TaxID=1843236 RepID=UPI00096FD60B|nr:cadherin-like domain-containing protein [Sphingomonas montana]
MTLISSVVGEEIFLQGQFLNVGFNSGGGLGTRSTATTGIVTDAVNGYIRLGMVADFDGFGKGAAATRDAMLAGTPVEGFSVGYDIGSKHYVKTNNERLGTTQITGGDTTNLSTATSAKAGWVGTTTENVKVSQTVTLADDAKYLKFEVTMTNQSTATLDDLRYMRTIDPDHGADFKTINTIVEQGGDDKGGALAAAYMTNGKNPLFYYTQDERAKVSTFGLANLDPYAKAAWDDAAKIGTSVKADQAINLDFSLGKLAAGESTTVTFYLGITDDLATTVARIDSESRSVRPAPTPEPVNAVPVAVADTLTVKAGTEGTGNVLANDRDADGTTLTAKLVSGPAHGTLKLNADGGYSYTGNAGWSGTDSFVYAASDGKASAQATATITVTPAPNTAPTAVADAVRTTGTAVATGNVLFNDRDDDGDALTAAVHSGPANGTVTMSADGAFQYVARDGFSGTDSFSYAASDGKTGSVATVSVTVDAPPPPTPPASAPPAPPPPVSAPPVGVLGGPGVQYGSAAESQTLTATKGHDVFFFDVASGKVGADTVVGFGADDLLVTSKAIMDGNGDGIITWNKARVTLDTGSTVGLAGVKSLRLMGSDDEGHFIYANGGAKPKNALESRMGNDLLSGDATDKKAQTFFFDTNLELKTGSDKVVNFGAKDVLVTTSALDVDGSGHIGLGTGGLLSLDTDGLHLGDVSITGIGGRTISTLEFDGSVQRDGMTYYVYSMDGSAVGAAALAF